MHYLYGCWNTIPRTAECQRISQIMHDAFSNVISTLVDKAHDSRKRPGCARRLAAKTILLCAINSLYFLLLILITLAHILFFLYCRMPLCTLSVIYSHFSEHWTERWPSKEINDQCRKLLKSPAEKKQKFLFCTLTIWTTDLIPDGDWWHVMVQWSLEYLADTCMACQCRKDRRRKSI